MFVDLTLAISKGDTSSIGLTKLRTLINDNNSHYNLMKIIESIN